ncbi:MAG TPA: hypothetical protein VFK52_08900 [Nocardioidaceae bacterium]|nr:hypothetical protein [Nocardioidaceae bacterium]
MGATGSSRKRALKSGGSLTAAALVVVLLAVVRSSPAAAHCPDAGNNGYHYVSGGNGNHNFKSVRTRIGWIHSPNVCNSISAYSISIVRTSGADTGWLQVGWVFRAGYTKPMGYCERNPLPSGTGTYALTEYTVPEQAQFYTYEKNDVDTFECKINGVLERSTPEAYIGFINGGWVPVQAEALANQVQLGRVAPDWLAFTATDRIVAGGTAWSAMTVGGVGSDDPVWNFRQPVTDGFEVNTDATH